MHTQSGYGKTETDVQSHPSLKYFPGAGDKIFKKPIIIIKDKKDRTVCGALGPCLRVIAPVAGGVRSLQT